MVLEELKTFHSKLKRIYYRVFFFFEDELKEFYSIKWFMNGSKNDNKTNVALDEEDVAMFVYCRVLNHESVLFPLKAR